MCAIKLPSRCFSNRCLLILCPFLPINSPQDLQPRSGGRRPLPLYSPNNLCLEFVSLPSSADCDSLGAKTMFYLSLAPDYLGKYN